MLSTTLQKMIDSGLTSAREIGDLTGVAPSTVYRWIRGESQPDFNAMRLLVRHLPNPDAVESILSAFTAGTGWRFYNIEAELDVNQDGVINAEDALDAAISAVRSAGKSCSEVRSASRAGAVEREQCVALIDLLNDVIRQCSVTQQVLIHISEKRGRRKLKLVE